MERKIGEIFEYNGEWYQCIVENGCENCAFNERNCYTIVDECCADRRKDNKNVIFKKLEKIGGTYEKRVSDSTFSTFQRYKVYNSVILPKKPYMYYNFIDSTIEIEIKQTKEDMEEKNNGNTPLNVLTDKYVKGDICYDDFEKEVKALYSCKEEIKPTLKEFDLEAAKLGKPVCTRDGAKARIICFDAKSDAPIIALITTDDGTEITFDYLSDGTFFNSENPDNDLMMLPERKEGWINIYNADTTFYYVDGRVFETKDEAVQEAKEEVEKEQREKDEYIDTIRVEWEE